MTDPLLIDVPQRLQTSRLLLRPFTEADAPALHEALVESLASLREHLWALPWVAEEQTLASARLRCIRADTNFKLRTDLAWLAFEASSDRLVGSFGLHRTDWALPATEVGYWLRPSAWGEGFATEGVNALVAWAFEGLCAERVALVTDEANRASCRVAERCGFVLEGVQRRMRRAPGGELRHTCLYARYRPTR
jgi:RimJ/RimL family protein N-acetyltransferase